PALCSRPAERPAVDCWAWYARQPGARIARCAHVAPAGTRPPSPRGISLPVPRAFPVLDGNCRTSPDTRGAPEGRLIAPELPGARGAVCRGQSSLPGSVIAAGSGHRRVPFCQQALLAVAQFPGGVADLGERRLAQRLRGPGQARVPVDPGQPLQGDGPVVG